MESNTKTNSPSTEAGSPPDNNSSQAVQEQHHHTGTKKHPTLPKLKGRIELIIGPMFAGKSTELLRRMKRHEIAGSKCLRIKFSDDTRYSNDSIATHDR
jgi:hypothetical protein